MRLVTYRSTVEDAARLRDALGGQCRYAISGGAALGERLGHFYRGVGLLVLGAWLRVALPAT